VADPLNLPRGVAQPRVPIMVGGNGPEVTWRLAARYADELNLDGMGLEETRHAIPVIRSRCEEIERDPDSLRVSAHLPWRTAPAGRRRAEWLRSFAEAGVARAMALIPAAVEDGAELERFADDARAAGIPMAG
jgi:alkanesulfonate monooxygenase SsuD/methylene tetrahydromethanopterin reductase-like flavin-dependent oxidoreductase (luciferase family)